MRSPTFLTDPRIPLVADISRVINVIATGCAPAIIRALPNPIVAVDVIPGELDTGRQRGRHHADRLQELVDAGQIEIVSLSEPGWLHFEPPVAGPAPQTLDDGEAATIAYAAERGAVAIIDERKGTRLCERRAWRFSHTTSMRSFVLSARSAPPNVPVCPHASGPLP